MQKKQLIYKSIISLLRHYKIIVNDFFEKTSINSQHAKMVIQKPRRFRFTVDVFSSSAAGPGSCGRAYVMDPREGILISQITIQVWILLRTILVQFKIHQSGTASWGYIIFIYIVHIQSFCFFLLNPMVLQVFIFNVTKQASWWFQPIWKNMIIKFGNLPQQTGVKMKSTLKPPASNTALSFAWPKLGDASNLPNPQSRGRLPKGDFDLRGRGTRSAPNGTQWK